MRTKQLLVRFLAPGTNHVEIEHERLGRTADSFRHHPEVLRGSAPGHYQQRSCRSNAGDVWLGIINIAWCCCSRLDGRNGLGLGHIGTAGSGASLSPSPPPAVVPGLGMGAWHLPQLRASLQTSSPVESGLLVATEPPRLATCRWRPGVGARFRVGPQLVAVVVRELDRLRSLRAEIFHRRDETRGRPRSSFGWRALR